MQRLFGAGKKEEPQPQPPKKQQPEKEEEPPKEQVPKPTLSDHQSKMEGKVRDLTQTVNKLDAEAKQLLQKSKKSKGTARQQYKQRCMMVLKKRKLYENQLKQYMNQQFTLDQVAFTSQSIQNTLEMGKMMKEAVETQKQVMKDMDVDHLDDLRDEMDELKYESDYMNEMLNRDYDLDVDEDELDDELGELQQQLKAQKQIKKKQQMQQNQMNAA